MTGSDLQLEACAEHIVFAHESDAVAPPPSRPETAEFERIAALAAAACSTPLEPPPTLQATLAAAGLAFCAGRSRAPGRGATTTPRARGAVLAFALGAAAAGIAVWLAISPSPEPSLQQRRATVLASERTAVQKPWQQGPSPLRGDVAGDVVWCAERQEGWLTVRGLPPLGPDRCYQLWIVDRRRDGAPVDGGVFTVADAAAETLVAIDAKLTIGEAAAFVVTVEPAGGVVVSKQDHVVAIAAL